MRLSVVVATVFIVAIFAACGGGEEKVTDSSVTNTPFVTYLPLETTAVSTPVQTPEPTSTPDPTSEPTVEPTPLPTMEQIDPSLSDLEYALAVYQAVGELPANERFEIVFEPIGTGGRFNVKFSDQDTYIVLIREAQEWFRSRGYNLCEGPLYLTTLYTGAYPLGVPLEEPCEK